MDHHAQMKTDPHSYAENFIPEDHFKSQARARGIEVGAVDVTPGAGAYLRHIAFSLSAQSVVEVGTGSGVGSLWLLDGMLNSGTLTSIDDEMEHTRIAKIALSDANIAQTRYRLITNSVLDVISKLTDRAYDLVVLRHNPQELAFVIGEAHRILRSGGALVIDNFFGGSKVCDPAQRDPKTVSLRDAGKIIKNDTERWMSTLITTGDGLLVATKL
jgi:predicted O-methyltransferase YrrM